VEGIRYARTLDGCDPGIHPCWYSAADVNLPSCLLVGASLLLGLVLLDPFLYSLSRIDFVRQNLTIKGIEIESYPDIKHAQSIDFRLANALQQQFILQRKRRKIYPTLNAAVAAYRASIPDIEQSSAATLLSRGSQRVRRPKHTVLTEFGCPVLDEQPIDSALPADAVPSDFDPQKEEIGWVYTHDPTLNAISPLEFSIGQIHTAATFISCPSLLVPFRNQTILNDHAYLQHIHSILVDGTVFDLQVGKGPGCVVDVAGGPPTHLDDPARGGALPASVLGAGGVAVQANHERGGEEETE
jgi:hypothetical protein